VHPSINPAACEKFANRPKRRLTAKSQSSSIRLKLISATPSAAGDPDWQATL